jgi:N-acetylglucosaminylphosphatidylinositol deacetylase
VYTFDAGGVSGHPNHAAAAEGVLHWWAAAPSSSSASSLPQLWQLETVSLPRKYVGPLDAPLSWAATALRRRRRGQGAELCLTLRRPRRAWRALLAHRSQMVW